MICLRSHHAIYSQDTRKRGIIEHPHAITHCAYALPHPPLVSFGTRIHREHLVRCLFISWKHIPHRSVYKVHQINIAKPGDNHHPHKSITLPNLSQERESLLSHQPHDSQISPISTFDRSQ